MPKFTSYLHAKYRAFALLSCLESPRQDVIRGWRKWCWLVQQRRAGRQIDPSIEIRCLEFSPEKLLIGHGGAIDKGTIIWISDEVEGTRGSITLGERSYVGPYCQLNSCHTLAIGKNTLIGAHSYLITVHHRTDQANLPIADQGYRGGDITIGDNVWVGCHVTILPGVTIGNNAIIGAGAVVTKDVPAGETWAGVPAQKIKEANP